MNNAPVFLEISRLGKSFGGMQVLNDVTFDLNEGEILSLAGPNGLNRIH